MKHEALIIGTLMMVALIALPQVGMAKGPPTNEDPDAAGELYGDLYVIERDGAGKPLTRDVTYVDPETGEVTVSCLQPLADSCAMLPFWGECGLATLPEGVLPLPTCTFDPEVNDPCEVYSSLAPYDYGNDLQEVSFGRGSVTRSQPFVVDSAYGEFLKVINDAIGLGLDAANRLMMEIPTEDDPLVYFWKTVDAPLENLGMYRETMLHGCFDIVTEEITGDEGASMIRTSALDPTAIFLLEASGLGHLVCPFAEVHELTDFAAALAEEALCTVTDDPAPTPIHECWWELPDLPENPAPGDGVDADDMQSATGFLAAATDKSNRMSLDEMININTYMGINPTTWTRSKKDRILTVEYFPFTDVAGPDGWFGYTRSDVFPLGRTADLLVYQGDVYFFEDPELALFDASVSPYPYDFVDLDASNLTVCRGGSPDPEVCDDAWADDVYPGTGETDTGCGGANWFAQATEHARKTIWYIHNWAVPELGN